MSACARASSLCEAGARDPALRQSRRAVDGRRCAGADPDLDGLGRTQREARFGDPEPPRGTHRFARQEAPDNVERFLESRRTRPHVGAHRGEPVVTPAEPALHDEGALRDGRQRPDLLGHQHRVPQRQQEQAPGRRLAPFREKPPEDRRVLIIGRGRHVLIADKQGIERGTACRRGPLDHPARSLARIFHVRVIARQRDPDPHRVDPCRRSASIRPELADQAKDRSNTRCRARTTTIFADRGRRPRRPGSSVTPMPRYGGP